MTFSQFFESKYFEWQKQTGGRKTLSQFADYLDIPQTHPSMV